MKTRKSSLFCFLLVFGFLATAQEIEISSNTDDQIFHLDSIGNRIGYEKARELLRTGKYISVPKVNPSFEIEFLITEKNENNPEHNQYEVYTDGKNVISTKALKSSNRLVIGDTIVGLSAHNSFNNSTYGKRKNTNTILVITTQQEWLGIKQKITSLIEDYPKIDFILVPFEKHKSLQNYFSKGFLKRKMNVFLANEVEKELFPLGNDFPIFYMLDNSERIILIFPSLVARKTPFYIMQNYLKSFNLGG